MAGLFITGTDTGVGKTYVGCGLALLLRAQGKKVGVMKPVETGCTLRAGKLYPEDAARLRLFSGIDLPLETICPYRFSDPLAPSVAAERAGCCIEIDQILANYEKISGGCDLTLVEGAGGLLTPVRDDYTWADFIRDLRIPVLVVVASRLGAINHALLTTRHAQSLGIEVSGYILNHLHPHEDLVTHSNGPAIARLAKVPYLGSLPFHPQTNEEALLSLFAASINFVPLG